MLVVTLALLGTTLPAQGFGAAPADEDALREPPAACAREMTPDLENVADVQLAPVGGRWWVSRYDDEGGLRISDFATLAVGDGAGLTLALGDLILTPAAVNIGVPAEAAPGQVLQLLVDGAALPGVALRVAEGTASEPALVVESATVVATAPLACDILCTYEGMTVPAAPELELSYQGGPAILDVWTMEEWETTSDEWQSRVVDSRLLEASEGPASLALRIGEVGWSTGLTVRVRLLAPDSRATLHDESLAVAPLGEVPLEETELSADVDECETGGGGPVSGCSSSALPRDAGLPLVALGLLACLALVVGRARAARARSR